MIANGDEDYLAGIRSEDSGPKQEIRLDCCDAFVEVSYLGVNDIVTCPECKSEFIVKSVNPLELELAPLREDEIDKM